MALFDNVEVATQSTASDFCLSWTRDSDHYRYHVWLDRVTKQVRASLGGGGRRQAVLYKNPPIGVERGELGFFETRRLDASKHYSIIDAVKKHAYEAGLFVAADRAVETREQAEHKAQADAIALKRVEAAAPTMLRALKAAQFAFGFGSSATPQQQKEAAEAVTTAILEAEGDQA